MATVEAPEALANMGNVPYFPDTEELNSGSDNDMYTLFNLIGDGVYSNADMGIMKCYVDFEEHKIKYDMGYYQDYFYIYNSDIFVDDNIYVCEKPSGEAIAFYVVDGAISRVQYKMNPYRIFDLYKRTDYQYTKLVTLMGDKVYTDSNDDNYTISVADGTIYLNEGESKALSGSFDIFKEGNNIVMTNTEENDMWIFYANSNGVKSVAHYADQYNTYSSTGSETDVIEVLGNSLFADFYSDATISVVDNHIILKIGNEEFSMESAVVKFTGENFELEDESNGIQMMILCTGGKVDGIYFSKAGFEYSMSDVTYEQELIELMQGKDFADPNTPCTINLQGGHINCYYGQGGYPLFGPATMTKKGNDYVFSYNKDEFFFVVEDGRVARIDYKVSDFSGSMFAMADEKELADLMGSNEYIGVGLNVVIKAGNDQVCFVSEDDGSLEPINENYMLTIKSGDNYVIGNGVFTYTFVVENGAVIKIEEDNPLCQYIYVKQADFATASEDDLIELVGENTYNKMFSDTEENMFIKDGRICIGTSENYRNLTEAAKIYNVAGMYLIEDKDGEGTTVYYTFEIKNGSLAKVRYFDSEEVTWFVITPSLAELTALMGENQYIDYKTNGSINVSGANINSTEKQTYLDRYYNNLFKDGDNYVLGYPGQVTYTFVVENGQVTKIEYNEPPYKSGTYVKEEDEAGLAALIGEDIFHYNDRYIFVDMNQDRNDVILAGQHTGERMEISYYLYKEGDNYVYAREKESYTFVVEDGQLTRIEYKGFMKGSYTFVKAIMPSELIDLMGNNVYVREDNEEVTISVMEEEWEGETMKWIAEKSDSDEEFDLTRYFVIDKSGDNYVMADSQYSYTFVVENNKVVRIDFKSSKESYSYIIPNSTSIERVDVIKRDKAIKTIENGKVVIIRDGKKYNLSGMRLN